MRKWLQFMVLLLIAPFVSVMAQTAPFTQSFNTAAAPTGWVSSNNQGSTSTNGFFKYGGTLGYDASGCSDNTGNAGSYAWVDGSSPSTPAPFIVTLRTDSVDISSLSSLYLEFFYYSYNVSYASSGYNHLAVDFYDGTTWHDSVFVYQGSSSSPGWQYAGVDLSTYTTSGKVMFRFDVAKVASTAFYNDIALDDIAVKNAPACPLPINLSATSINAYGATLNWSTVGAATSYNVLYGLAGFDPSTATASTTSADSIVITGLTPASAYDFYVVANCGTNGYSDTSGPASFITGCAAVTLPYSQNFDAITASNSTANPGLPPCWLYYETPGHPGYGYTYSSLNPNSSPNHMRFYSSSGYGDTIMIISPQFIGLSNSDKEVVFWAKSNTTSYNSPVAIGTMSDPNDPSTLDILATVMAPQNYTEFIVPVDASSGYNGTDSYIAIVCIQPASPIISLYVDDITIQAQPPCPKPSLPVLGAVSSSTQAVSWSSTGTAFNLEWGPTGFSQGTGFTGTSVTNSYSITSLAPSSTYDVYIQNNCAGAGNGLSVWEGPLTFTTLCNTATMPYTEDFNSWPPPCFTFTNNGGWDWDQDAAGYARARFWSYSSGTAFMSAGIVNISQDAQVRFKWAHLYSTSYPDDRLLLRARVVGTTQWDTLIDLVGTAFNTPASGNTTPPSNSSGFMEEILYLDTAMFNGEDVEFQFAAITDYGPHAYVDDFTVEQVPLCQPSSNMSTSGITNSVATLMWSPGEGMKHHIEYGPTGFTQGTGPVIMGITDSSYVLTGLAGNTCYDVYLRDSCSSSLSPWYGPITFCTACDPLATPISENFDNTPTGGTTNPSVPSCWGYWENPNATTSCYGYTYGFATPNGTNHFRMYSFNTATDSLALISPGVMGLSAGNKLIKFYAKSGSTIGSTQLLVGTTPSQADMRNATVLDTIQTDIGTTYSTEFTVYLDTASGYNGTDQYVFIMMAGTPATYYQAYIDDITIESIPLCGAPWNISSSAITASGATIDWSTYYGTSFQIEYGPTGFIPGTGLATTVNNVTSGTSISGLNPNTYYDVYVSDMCDTTNQAGPYTFKTNCLVQLNGAYTVGGTPGPSNFATLDSALSVLNGCGITGPVTFNLQGGTHAIPATTFSSIVGVSATNTVTFNGGGVGVDTISFGAGASIAMTFDAAEYITFQNLTFDASGSDRPVWLTNATHHITFDHCDVLGNATATSSLTSVIAASGSSTSVSSTGNNANHITITNCKISGGYYGLSIYGGGTSLYVNNFVITDNEFVDQYFYAMRTYYADTITLERNVIDGVRNSSGYGFYMYYNSNASVKRNKVFVPTYGIYMYNANYNSATSSSDISNNFFGASTTYGLYVSIPNNVTIHHNSVRGGSYGCYLTGTASNVDVRNNIFESASNYALYIGATFTNFTLDYNIYHTGGSNIAYQGGAQATLAAWQTSQPTLNVNSLQGDPGYLSTNDFHIVGTLPNDAGVNGLATVDVDGDMRPASGSTTVDIGADEFTPLSWDASLDALLVTLAGCGDSTTTVEAVVTNYGLNTITSLPITVDVTGGVTQMLSITSTASLAQGQTDTIMVGSINTYAGAAGVMFEGYSSLTGDQNTSNDTLMEGPGNYFPVIPQHFPVDTVCANADSATFAALTMPGVEYGWFANPTDTVAAASGDSLTFAVSGQQTWYLGYTGSGEQTLVTAYAGGNSCGGGVMFNITATSTVNITGFEVSTTLAAGTAVPLTVYYIPNGTYLGNELNAAAWTTHSSTTATSAGLGNATVEVLPSSLLIPAGTTYAIYLNYASSYTNGNGANQVVSNADMTLNLGIGMCGLFTGANNPRVFNGGIIYGGQACSDIKVPMTLGINTDTAMAAFTSTVQANGADVDFDATGSFGDTYSWNFGDGSTGSGMTTMHTYAVGGTYTACLTVTDSTCNSTDSTCQTVLVTVGQEESLLNQSLNVFPNPSNGKFRVEFQVEGLKDVSIRVSTLLGQEIYASQPGNVSGEYREEFDLSNEATGIYVLQIITDDNVVSRRITIRK